MHRVLSSGLLSKIFTSLLFSCSTTFSEPFLAPINPFLRHEIRLLGDSVGLAGIQNCWPLDLGAHSNALFDQSAKDISAWLLKSVIERESDRGWSPIFASIGLADDRVIARGFGPEPRAKKATNVTISWMNDQFVGKLSMNALYGVKEDWKGRKEDGFALDGSYLATRLGNWSASLGKQERWWGPGWDGSLILSTNARPIPSISIDRREAKPFKSRWLSWLGPWSFHSFIGRMEEERTIPNPFLWGMRGEINPTNFRGLNIGFFRTFQLGGKGRPNDFNTWVDAFLSQDNYGGNTGKNDRSLEPGNQLAGMDFRWRLFDSPIALYGQLAGEDEDNFLPNCLMFLYGFEMWGYLENGTFRFFAEYADTTSYWWTGDPRDRNISYGHHIYKDGYRYHGRPIGHWADQDSRILSVGAFLNQKDGVGWGVTLREGSLNEDGFGSSSVSNQFSTQFISVDLINARNYQNRKLSVYTKVGVESRKSEETEDQEGISAFLTLRRIF